LIIITDSDLDDQPVKRNGKTYTRASDFAHNGNPFSYSGNVQVYFGISKVIDFSSLIIEDTDGSQYEWIPYGEANWIAIKDVELGIGEHKQFFFDFRVVEPQPIFDWALFFLPFIIVILLILTIICLVRIIKKEIDTDKKKLVVFVGLGSFFTALVLIVAIYVLPIFQ
jgi:hypothetical protein